MADTENNKSSNSPASISAPSLRFPGFTEPWQKKKLSAIANIVGRIGFRGYTTNDIVKKGEGALALSPTNIENNALTYNKDNTYVSFYKYEESPEIQLTEGDIVFVKTGSTVGKVAYVSDLITKTTVNPQLVVLKDIKVDSYLLSVILSTNLFQNSIKRITVGGAVPTLSQNAMGQIFVTIPSKEEQRKIAELLLLLDERIATQRRLIEDLEKLKSSIDRCYRGNEYIRLGDFITQVSKRNKSNLPYKVMSVSNVRGFVPQSEQFADREIASENTASYKIVAKDIFAYNPARINIGSIARFKGYYKGIVSPMYVCFSVTEELQPQYLEYFFQTRKFKNDVELRLEGSVRRCLNFDALCEIEIPLLTLPEQVAISSAIDTVSRKISFEGDVLTKLIIQRNYLLSKLFI